MRKLGRNASNDRKVNRLKTSSLVAVTGRKMNGVISSKGIALSANEYGCNERSVLHWQDIVNEMNDFLRAGKGETFPACQL